MWLDPIVEEVRKVREAHAAKFNYDLRAIYQDLKDRAKQSGWRLESRPQSGLCERVSSGTACVGLQVLVRPQHSNSQPAGTKPNPASGRYGSATTGFTNSPIPSTRTATSSPGFSQRGGLRAKPTPGGVPVAMISPGSNVKTLDK